LTKTVTPNTAGPGSNLTYTINLVNNGPGAATAVTVTDNLPAGTAFVSCSATNGGICNGSGNNRVIGFASLAQGATATITLTAAVNCVGVTGSRITNTVVVTASSTDPIAANNTATATVNLAPPQAKITLEGGASSLDFGSTAAARE